MVWLGYDPATVVFLITRVGTSQDAIKFVEELSADDQIGSMIYASGKDLATKRSAFLRTNGEAGYTALVCIRMTAGKRIVVLIDRLNIACTALFSCSPSDYSLEY